jgi:LAO/AO transport system kinase
MAAKKKKKSAIDDTLQAQISDVLAGKTRAIARMVSRAESGAEESRPALAEIYSHTGRAHVVGLTGVPGSGKSTLVRALAATIRADERKVGIVAIDPSSPYSGGAILGDRVRMTELTGDPGVFIRSMATRGAMGGLARASLDAVDILDAAGFEVVLVETVGVGQDEVDIVQAAHTVVVVSAPGLGDEIQAIKAGILEIADIHVVSKADRSDANKTVADLKGMLSLGFSAAAAAGWSVPVVPTSAEKKEGIEDLLATIDAHHDHLIEHGGMDERLRRKLEMRILKTAEDMVRERFKAHRGGRLAALLDQVAARDMDPYAAAADLLADFNED